jgi:two-component system, LytTR family, sensor kinase
MNPRRARHFQELAPQVSPNRLPMTGSVSATPDSRRWPAWLAVAGIWTLLGLSSAAQNVASRVMDGRPSDWTIVFPRTLADWLTCGLFTPAIVWLVRRAPPSARHPFRTAALYVTGAIAFILLKSALFAPLARLLSPGRPSRTWMEQVSGNVFSLSLTFAAVTGAVVALDHLRRARERELRASRLEAQLAQVQLHALRAQLNPHFLFNALNALSALIHSDPAAADRMVLRLGELLRQALDAGDAAEVPLRDELRLVERYLDVMKIRLGDRLQVQMEVAPEALDALVPSLLLQPLVENAVQHGIGGRADAGRLRIAARRQGEQLMVEIDDDGPGISAEAHERVGLGNTRLRLRQLYGDAHALELRNGEAGGARLRVRLPFRAADGAA